MSNILTPAFVADLETQIQLILNDEFGRLAQDQVWTSLAKERPSAGKKEILTWLLDTATIDYVGRLGAEVKFDDLEAVVTEVTNKAATTGLELNRAQMTDVDSMGVVGGAAINLAANWARQVGALSAYWPQEQVFNFVRDGGQTASKSYDGEVFFSTAHPLNPFDVGLGTYANDFTGAASGLYPGAVPIGGSTTVDVALANIQKARAYVQSIRMPNGRQPRKLKIRGIMAPPALASRVQELTHARFIAQAAASGGGSADIESVIADWGFGTPIFADELASPFTNGSDSTYYLVAETIASNPLGALVYSNREPFSVVFNGEMTSAELSRRNALQWVLRGRNAMMYGHPFLIFRCQAT